MMRRLFSTNASAATVLVRLLTSSVFLSEGIQKFLYPAELAAGRFAKIGIPAPDIMGPFVGGCEVLCGTLLIIGLLTRLAAIVLLIDISVAIVSTKIPVLLGHGFWGFSLMKLPRIACDTAMQHIDLPRLLQPIRRKQPHGDWYRSCQIWPNICDRTTARRAGCSRSKTTSGQ